MALLPILEFPDPRLRTRAAPVQQFDAALKQLIADMLQTMYAAPGIGLAATQVNVHRQLLVMDVSTEKNQPQVYINPRLSHATASKYRRRVACRCRTSSRKSSARRASGCARRMPIGVPFERELDGLAAVCLQHEMDHLAGKLFVDYLSGLKRERIRRKLEKERRERASGAVKPAARAAARVI